MLPPMMMVPLVHAPGMHQIWQIVLGHNDDDYPTPILGDTGVLREATAHATALRAKKAYLNSLMDQLDQACRRAR